ncbi:MAG: FHIPEP family type III secretion protein, partial [SAR324 cluster bacterium]|nr:FHIPEP family type III secretion protein [SAR324 cluster bacterium]
MKVGRHTDFMLAIGVVSIIMVLVLPLAPILLDLLLTTSIAVAVLILFVSLFTRATLDFSAFPTILLISTLFRLSLNVASTRLILVNGNQGLAAAGNVIKSFGDFVVGGNFVVGIIIFLILVVINFVVITKGAGRIAEVAARFTLDAMPGKQMAIDADLNAGIIEDTEAKERRVRIQQEADFYGAMDGASKFVRGDAIAGLIITGVNIIGGLVIGVFQFGMDLETALDTYTVLTVGDGLVAQIPALIVSMAAGIAVTKASGDETLADDIKKQLLGNHRAMSVASLVIFGFAIIPGMPTLPMMVVASTVGLIAYLTYSGKQRASAEEVEATAAEAQQAAEEAPEDIEALLPIDRLGIELGFGLIPLVDAEQDGELLERIKSIRRQLATEMGFIVPPIHIKDNLDLAPGAYSIIIKGVEVGRSEVMLDHLLAMKTGDVDEDIAGVDTIEPAFGLPALWIPPEDQE